MKIETESFNFTATVNPLDLGLNELQTQYLTYLQGKDSIEQLVIRMLNNGWLVNFQELYNLVEKLVQKHLISNPNILQYFNKTSHLPAIKNSTAATQVVIPALDLSQLPFFRSLPRELSDQLLQNATVKKFPIEAFICKAGDTDRNLYILLKGQAAIYRDKKFICTVGANGIFGEASFLTGSVKSADILALQTSEVLVVPYQTEVLDPILKQNSTHEISKRFYIQNALMQSEFFKKIPLDCLDALTFAGRVIELKNEQILFKENDIGNAAYLVVQGQIKINKNGQLISTLSQGGFLGEMALTVSNGARVASAFAHGNAMLLEITRDSFYRLLSKNLFLAKEIQALAANRKQSNLLKGL